MEVVDKLVAVGNLEVGAGSMTLSQQHSCGSVLLAWRTGLTHLEEVEHTGQAEVGNIAVVDSLEAVAASHSPVEVAAAHTGHIPDNSPVGAGVGPEVGNESPVVVAEWDIEGLEQVAYTGVAVGGAKQLEGVGGVLGAHLSGLGTHSVNNQVCTI